MANQIQLSKTCISCGASKPLTAFLQISGPQGTSYGNICAACRGSAAEAQQIVVPEQHTDEGTAVGLKIDAKTKVQIEKDKRGAKEKQVELDKVEQDKHELVIDEKQERKELKEEAEKKHRENYIEPRKTESFFGRKAETKPTVSPIQTGEPATQRIAKEEAIKSEAIKTDVQHQEASAKQDNLEKGIDTTNIHTDQYIAGKAKMHSEIFSRFKAWLPSAPVTLAERQKQATKQSSETVKQNKEHNKAVDETKETPLPASPTSKRR